MHITSVDPTSMEVKGLNMIGTEISKNSTTNTSKRATATTTTVDQELVRIVRADLEWENKHPIRTFFRNLWRAIWS